MKKKKPKLLIAFIAATIIVFSLFSDFVVRNLTPVFKKIVTGAIIQEPNLLSNLLIPSAVTSIILSVIALVVVIFLIVRIRKIGVVNTFPLDF